MSVEIIPLNELKKATSKKIIDEFEDIRKVYQNNFYIISKYGTVSKEYAIIEYILSKFKQTKLSTRIINFNMRRIQN